MTLSLFLHLVTGSPTLDSEGWNSGDGGMWMRKRAFLSISQYSEMCGQGIWEESSAAQVLSSPDEPFLSSLLVNLPPFAQKLFFHCRAMVCSTWECKLAESQWTKAWRGWTKSAANWGCAGCSSLSRCYCMGHAYPGATRFNWRSTSLLLVSATNFLTMCLGFACENACVKVRWFLKISNSLWEFIKPIIVANSTVHGMQERIQTGQCHPVS